MVCLVWHIIRSAGTMTYYLPVCDVTSAGGERGRERRKERARGRENVRVLQIESNMAMRGRTNGRRGIQGCLAHK